MAQLKYDRAKKFLWVRDKEKTFPVYTLANLSNTNLRLTEGGYLEIQNPETNQWEEITDSTGSRVCCKGNAGPKGETGLKGDPGEKGDPGISPTIGSNGNWFIGTEDTGVPASKDLSAITTQLETISEELSTKQSQEDYSLSTTAKTIVGAINELYALQTGITKSTQTVTYGAGSGMQAIELKADLPAGTYIVHGSFSSEGSLPDAYRSCCIWVNASNPTQSAPADFTDPQIYSLGQEFQLEENLKIWLVFANAEYIDYEISLKSERWQPVEAPQQGTCTVSDCYIEAVGMSTYSLRGPQRTSMYITPQSQTLISKGSLVKKTILAGKTINSFEFTQFDIELSDSQIYQLRKEMAQCSTKIITTAGVGVSIYLEDDKIQPESLQTLQQIYDIGKSGEGSVGHADIAQFMQTHRESCWALLEVDEVLEERVLKTY